MEVTAATPQVWKAAKRDREKALTSPAPRESATTMKQVCFKKNKDSI